MIDWSPFDKYPPPTCFCRCGAIFLAHAKFSVEEGGLVSRRPCPRCSATKNLFRVSTDWEAETISPRDVSGVQAVMNTLKLTDGKEYQVAHAFGPDRAIIVYDGLFVLVDRISTGDYELSGEPARAEEAPILNALVNTIKTTTTVTKG